MHKIPGVSVIMSVFNGEDFLADAIKSVLNQTFTNFEFIIVDDGSNDSSLAIIQSFQELDSRIKIIVHKNQGLAKSLNIGIEHSIGKYIARIDADDLCYESRLAKQYTFMEENHAVAHMRLMGRIKKRKSIVKPGGVAINAIQDGEKVKSRVRKVVPPAPSREI